MTLPILQVRKQRPEEIFDLPDSEKAPWRVINWEDLGMKQIQEARADEKAEMS